MLGNLQLIVIDFIAFSQCFNVMIVGRWIFWVLRRWIGVFQ
jgi:hypothetical protein